MLDLARNPEDVFRAPLNTTKLAPVTDNENIMNYILFIYINLYYILICLSYAIFITQNVEVAHFKYSINFMLITHRKYDKKQNKIKILYKIVFITNDICAFANEGAMNQTH